MTDLEPGQVRIGNKIYDMVARRLHLYRQDHPTYSIATDLLENGQYVVMKATIRDDEGKHIADGHAEQLRGSSSFTDADVEVCETSALGRALALAGLPGQEMQMDPQIASADEVGNAIRQQADKQYGEYMALIHEHWDSIVDIKSCLLAADMATSEHPDYPGGPETHLEAAMEAWHELGKEVVTQLWKAPTKGGIFTTKERSQLKQFAIKGPI